MCDLPEKTTEKSKKQEYDCAKIIKKENAGKVVAEGNEISVDMRGGCGII